MANSAKDASNKSKDATNREGGLAFLLDDARYERQDKDAKTIRRLMHLVLTAQSK